MVKVKVKKLRVDAIVPKYAHPGDAGMDLFSVENIVVPRGERRLIKTGISMELPEGYFASIRGKSGLAYKKGILILAGVIEYTYRGEYGVVVVNTGDEDFIVEKDDKVAQVLIQPIATVELEEAEELSDTARGEGGFGSTDKKSVVSVATEKKNDKEEEVKDIVKEVSENSAEDNLDEDSEEDEEEKEKDEKFDEAYFSDEKD